MARKCGHCRSASTFTLGDKTFGCYECGQQTAIATGEAVAPKRREDDE